MSSIITQVLLTAASHCQPEADLEQKVILEFLKRLGYVASDWQAQATVGNSKPDFIIRPTNSEIPNFTFLVIEAKAPAVNIQYKSPQIKSYLKKTKGLFGLLTNGLDWQLYYLNPHETKAPQLIENVSLLQDAKKFEKLCQLLQRKTALSFIYHLYQRQHQAYARFGKVILKLYPDLKTDRPSQSEKKKMIITVFNNKGGVGKTTMTINLGAALANMGKKVLLIDVDAQANLSIGLSVDPFKDVEDVGKKDITHLLMERDTTLKDVIHRRKWGGLTLDIVPSHIRLSGMEPDLMRMINVDYVLAKKLKNHEYDYVLIDPPPSFSKVNDIALVASNAILIPTELSPYPIRALEYVFNRTYTISESIDRSIHILGVAISRYSPGNIRNNLDMKGDIYMILNRTAQKADLLSESTWIPQLLAMSRSTEKKCPIYSQKFYDESSSSDKNAIEKIITCYDNLAQNVINQSVNLQESKEDDRISR